VRRIVIGIVLGSCIAGAPSVGVAKKKPKPAGEVKKEQEGKRPPGDKSANEGAQGRQNATEDAARASEPPNSSYANPR